MAGERLSPIDRVKGIIHGDIIPPQDSVSVYEFKEKKRPGQGTTVIVFDGHGAQHVGMGKEIYDTYAYVREFHRRASTLLGYDLTEIMFYDPESEIIKTRHAQPAITLNNICIMNVIEREKGKAMGRLRAVTGESLGLFAAAWKAGVFGDVDKEGFDNVMHLTEQRGRIFQELFDRRPSGLVMVRASENLIRRIEDNFLGRPPERQLFPAIYTSKEIIVFGGNKQHIARAQRHLNGFGKRAVRAVILETASGAFHTPLSGEAQGPFKEQLDKLELHNPTVPVISNTYSPVRFLKTAQEVRQELADLTTKPVFRVDLVNFLDGRGVRRILEVGDKGLIAKGLSQDPRFKIAAGGVTIAVVGGIATAAVLIRRRRR